MLRNIAAACNTVPFPLLSNLRAIAHSFKIPTHHSSSLLNAHANEDDVTEAVAAFDPALSATPASPADNLRCMLADPIPYCSSPDLQFPPPPIDRAGRRLYYPLDYASVLSVAALRVVPGCSVLDVCAAPGGKSIAISQSLKSGGFLVCNEPDGDRRRRLTASLKEQCRLLPKHLTLPFISRFGSLFAPPSQRGRLCPRARLRVRWYSVATAQEADIVRRVRS